MKKKTLIIIIAVVTLIAAAIAGIVIKNLIDDKNSSANVVPWDVNIEDEQVAESDEILIPGYDSMYMKAGQKTQKVNIGNPADNNCYFIVTLKLEDGTELFKSDYLEPGQGLETIEINKNLKAGQYTAVIEYSCYTIKGKKPLNGGSCEFNLVVK